MAVEIESDINVKITREFASPPGRVYRAFVEEDGAAAWMWGANAPNPGAEVDLRVGGRYRIRRDAPADDTSGWGRDEWAIAGVYAEIVPEQRLVYTLHWEGPVGYNQTGEEVLDEVAIVEFEPVEAGTLVTYHHIGIPPDGVSAAQHGKGVDGSFDALAALLEG